PASGSHNFEPSIIEFQLYESTIKRNGRRFKKHWFRIPGVANVDKKLRKAGFWLAKLFKASIGSKCYKGFAVPFQPGGSFVKLKPSAVSYQLSMIYINYPYLKYPCIKAVHE